MNIGEEPIDPATAGRPDYPKRIPPFAFAWIATAVVFVFYGIGSSAIIGLFADSVTSDGVKITTPNLFTASIIAQVLFLLVPAFLLARRGPLPMRESLRLRGASVSFFFLAAFGVLACQILGAFWLTIQELYFIPDSLLPAYHRLEERAEWLTEHLFFGPDVPLFLFALLAIAVVPAISEEMMFRGVIQRNFEDRLNPIGAILLAALIFGALHLQPTNFVPLVGVGAFLGLAAWAGRSIWPAVFGHFVFNGLQVVLANLWDVAPDQVEPAPTNTTVLAFLPLVFISLAVVVSITRQFLRVGRSMNMLSGAPWDPNP